MVAFAANSVLCRLALEEPTIDAASFATIRLTCGAVTLVVISSLLAPKNRTSRQGHWTSAGMLFLYAVGFSFAYLSLTTATGALILFGAVQATMILAALWQGERPNAWEWAGFFLALTGLVYLVFPGLAAPSPLGSALMAIAGIAWGVYSLRGRRVQDALADTTTNFVRSVPMAVTVSVVLIGTLDLSLEGVILAAASGALASGVGYVVWYAALRGLTATRAATVQLSVPVLAALGGVLFLAETVTLRLVVAAFFILGGVGLAVAGRGRGRAVSA